MSTCADCAERSHDAARAVDNTPWDGNAAMTACSDAACYRAICAGRRAGDPSLRSSWALPHHKRPGSPPNAAGVRNSLSRLPQTQGLTNREEARRHLEAHMSAIQGSQSNAADPDAVAEHAPRDNLFRALRPGYELRDGDDDDGDMPTLVLDFIRFNEWTEIDSLFEGRFMEQIDPGSVTRTFTEDRDGMRVLFQHGRDPQIGDKPLGPIDVLEPRKQNAHAEAPLIDTSYNRDLLLPGLRAGLYGSSFRFQVDEDHWDKKPKRSKHNPEGLPERTILGMTVREFGPVTFPAYAKATAGVRSVTDDFLGLALQGIDLERLAGLLGHDFTGRPDQGMAGGGAHDTDGAGDEPSVAISPKARLRDRRLRVEGIVA